MTFRASISTNILRIDPSELVPSPAAHEARRRILAAGDAYQRAGKRAPEPPRPAIVETSADLAAALRHAMRTTPKRPAMNTKALARKRLQEIAERHGFSYALIFGRRKHPGLVAAREEISYRLVVEYPVLTHEMIGAMLGVRHDTVTRAAVRFAKQHGLPTPRRVNFSPDPKPATHRP